MTTMTTIRTPGRSGIEVSALGVGCWAIGGPFWEDGKPLGWGEVDDESLRALHRALDLGVTFFDTANSGNHTVVDGQPTGGTTNMGTVVEIPPAGDRGDRFAF